MLTIVTVTVVSNRQTRRVRRRSWTVSCVSRSETTTVPTRPNRIKTSLVLKKNHPRWATVSLTLFSTLYTSRINRGRGFSFSIRRDQEYCASQDSAKRVTCRPSVVSRAIVVVALSHVPLYLYIYICIYTVLRSLSSHLESENITTGLVRLLTTARPL